MACKGKSQVACYCDSCQNIHRRARDLQKVANTLDELADGLDLPNERKDRDNFRRLAEVVRIIVYEIDPCVLRISKMDLVEYTGKVKTP